jgi:uncharacterized membrane protein YfcA
MTFINYFLIGFGAFLAGLVNALAGGGTLITFPLLIALGVPAVTANVTNTVALCPGYFGATLAQRKDLLEQKHRLVWLIPAALVGGAGGAFLLLKSGERLFTQIIPWLILLAALLLVVGEPLKKWLILHAGNTSIGKRHPTWVAIPISLAAIYGGYFGAGLSVIVLAVLSLFYQDSLTKLNSLKQAIALAANVAAAVLFLFSDRVNWPVALLMACFALAGGAVGGRLAGKINTVILRVVVVTIAVIVALFYFLK